MSDQELTTQQRFEKEIAPINFQELQKFFAKGMMIVISDQLDMIEVALKLHEDNVEVIQQWIDQEKIARAHDDHARSWLKNKSDFMAVTVAPWVLVQEIKREVK